MTEDEWIGWRKGPIGREWERLLKKEAEGEDAPYFPDSVEKTALAAAHLHGFLEALELALSIEPNFEDKDEG